MFCSQWHCCVTSCSNTKVWKVTKNRPGTWVVLSQTRETQAVFHTRFLNCSQSCLFWISLRVGILIQLLLLECCWRKLLSFHLRKLSGLGWTMSWLAWPGVGSWKNSGRWGHLQGSLSRNSSVSCDYGPSLLKILNYSVNYPNFYNCSSLLKLGCWKQIMHKVGLCSVQFFSLSKALSLLQLKIQGLKKSTFGKDVWLNSCSLDCLCLSAALQILRILLIFLETEDFLINFYITLIFWILLAPAVVSLLL